jgi:hypothetical protein
MNSTLTSKESVHLACIGEQTRAALTSNANGGLFYPIDSNTHRFHPRFNHMDHWEIFLALHADNQVGDLGFKLPDPAQQEPGYYLAKSSMLRSLSRRDPVYAIIDNLENQWRIRWLRDLMEFIAATQLQEQHEVRFTARDLANHLWEQEPLLIPQKSWLCRGHEHTRIENTLQDLMIFSWKVKHEGITMWVHYRMERNPYGRGNRMTAVFVFEQK